MSKAIWNRRVVEKKWLETEKFNYKNNLDVDIWDKQK